MAKKRKKQVPRTPQPLPIAVVTELPISPIRVSAARETEADIKGHNESVQAYRNYALRVLAFSIGLKILLSGSVGLFGRQGSVNIIPYRDMLGAFVANIILLKTYVIYPALFITMYIRVSLWRIMVLSRFLFAMNLIITVVFFYGGGVGLGTFDRLYNFFLKTNPDQVQAQLPEWLKLSLSFLTSSILGAIILWGVTSWAWDIAKWLLAKVPRLLIQLLRAPKIIANSPSADD